MIPEDDVCIPQMIPRDPVIIDWGINQQMPAQFLVPLVLVLKCGQSFAALRRRACSQTNSLVIFVTRSLPMSWKPTQAR